jgi:cyclopropane-fatty-acyl-phospholipid synthase
LKGLTRRLVHQGLSQLQTGSVILSENGIETRLGTGDLEATLHVFDPRFYKMVLTQGAIGAALAYRSGYWATDDLTTLFRIFAQRRGTESALERRLAWLCSLPGYVTQLFRRNGSSNARKNIEAHYDLGNEFFELFLDPTMTYSCGIFEGDHTTLREASETKLRRIAEKLDLSPEMHVLEIGCGWGSFAILAAREFGCRVTGLTLSPSQHQEAARRVAEAGVSHLVDIRLEDYREHQRQYDAIASIEMIEAIGHHNLGRFFAQCERLVKPGGAMAIQAITMPDKGYKAYLRRTDVIRQLIFPGSCCPARSAILNAAGESSDFRAVHLEEFGPHYATTLRSWRERLDRNESAARELGYSPEFLRLWNFYLSYCEAGFAERHVGLIQAVFTRAAYQGKLEFSQSLASKGRDLVAV